MRLLEELERLDRENAPVHVAVAGAGQMGTDLVCQLTRMSGLRVAAVAEIEVDRALRAFAIAGIADSDINVSDRLSAIHDAIADGKHVVCQDISQLPLIENIDVVVDATGIPQVGAKLAWECILAKKHIIMLNVEADVTVGPILKHLADGAGVIYSGSAGDEPAATFELFEFARTLGFEVVAAGKGKNNPLDREATPATVAETASAQGMGVKMLTSFVDGTKTMVEMTALSNATGLIPDVSGMHGPSVEDFKQLPSMFAIREEGGILKRSGVVEYALGNIAPGVFVVFRSDLERVEQSLRYSKLGPGPNHVLYRPYHLISLETPLSVARASLKHEATIVSKGPPISETTAVAKRDLPAGESIDGIGGHTIYGSIDTVSDAQRQHYVPIGLLAGATVKTAIQKGQKITADMVELDEDSVVFHLRRLQDNYFGAA